MLLWQSSFVNPYFKLRGIQFLICRKLSMNPFEILDDWKVASLYFLIIFSDILIIYPPNAFEEEIEILSVILQYGNTFWTFFKLITISIRICLLAIKWIVSFNLFYLFFNDFICDNTELYNRQAICLNCIISFSTMFLNWLKFDMDYCEDFFYLHVLIWATWLYWENNKTTLTRVKLKNDGEVITFRSDMHSNVMVSNHLNSKLNYTDIIVCCLDIPFLLRKDFSKVIFKKVNLTNGIVKISATYRLRNFIDIDSDWGLASEIYIGEKLHLLIQRRPRDISHYSVRYVSVDFCINDGYANCREFALQVPRYIRSGSWRDFGYFDSFLAVKSDTSFVILVQMDDHKVYFIEYEKSDDDHFSIRQEIELANSYPVDNPLFWESAFQYEKYVCFFDKRFLNIFNINDCTWRLLSNFTETPFPRFVEAIYFKYNCMSHFCKIRRLRLQPDSLKKISVQIFYRKYEKLICRAMTYEKLSSIFPALSRMALAEFLPPLPSSFMLFINFVNFFFSINFLLCVLCAGNNIFYHFVFYYCFDAKSYTFNLLNIFDKFLYAAYCQNFLY